MKAKIQFAIGFVVILGLWVVGGRAFQETHAPKSQVPLTRVRRGTIENRIYTTGELRPGKTVMLIAPPVGGTLQIVHLASSGTRVRKDDLVIQFDPSEQEYNLEQAQADLAQAEQEIAKAKADAAVQAAQDKVDLLKARFNVRRAELDVSKNELLGAIDAKKNLLALDEAKRHLAQLEEDVKSRTASGEATIAVSEAKRNKARLAMQQAQANIEKMTVRAPLDGLVAVRENQDSTGGMYYTGMSLPEYREGDQVWPGRTVAQVVDVEDMEIQAKVDENDRANINVGQSVEVRMNAQPRSIYTGRVKTVAGMASSNFWGGSGARKFDASFQLDKSDGQLRPGLTAEVVIQGDKTQGALYLPPQAVFEKDGKPVVYVRNGARFNSREVKIVRRTEGEIIIDGLSEGTEVALVNPETEGKKTPKATGAAGPAISGGAP